MVDVLSASSSHFAQRPRRRPPPPPPPPLPPDDDGRQGYRETSQNQALTIQPPDAPWPLTPGPPYNAGSDDHSTLSASIRVAACASWGVPPPAPPPQPLPPPPGPPASPPAPPLPPPPANAGTQTSSSTTELFNIGDRARRQGGGEPEAGGRQAEDFADLLQEMESQQHAQADMMMDMMVRMTKLQFEVDALRRAGASAAAAQESAENERSRGVSWYLSGRINRDERGARNASCCGGGCLHHLGAGLRKLC